MTSATPPLLTASDIAAFIEARADMLALLRHVESLALPDGWIGAGFVRNAVWDVLHGREIDASQLNDIDVIFFDPADVGKEREAGLEQRLRALAPGFAWSVKNQARMHRRNGDAPYRDTQDAIAHWPETATAVAARAVDSRVEVIAPHGVGDLIGLVVRPTPAFKRKMEIYRERLTVKNWLARWPKLRVLMHRAEEARLTAPSS